MKRFQVIILLAIGLCGAVPGCIDSASPTGPEAGGSVSEQAATEKRKRFDSVFAEWKELLKRLRDARRAYRIASEDEQPALEKQYDALLEEGDQLQQELIDTAARAVVADPKKNLALGAFLMSVIDEHINAREYEKGNVIAQHLIDLQVDNPKLQEYAGRTAFNMNDFANAQKHLAVANEKNWLTLQGKEQLKTIPFYIKAWEREEQLRRKDKEAEATKPMPRVLMRTTKGDVIFELFADEAPNTVANFISLVNKGFYDGLTFHRVLDDIAQGGCPKGNGTGHPKYRILSEFNRPNARQHFRGSLSMANSGPNTGGSQFFVALEPTRAFNGKHTVFGRVIEGMDVVSRLTRRDPDIKKLLRLPPKERKLPTPDRILSAEVTRTPPGVKIEDYDPKTIRLPDKTEQEEKFEYELPILWEKK